MNSKRIEKHLQTIMEEKQISHLPETVVDDVANRITGNVTKKKVATIVDELLNEVKDEVVETVKLSLVKRLLKWLF